MREGEGEGEKEGDGKGEREGEERERRGREEVGHIQHKYPSTYSVPVTSSVYSLPVPSLVPPPSPSLLSPPAPKSLSALSDFEPRIACLITAHELA